MGKWLLRLLILVLLVVFVFSAVKLLQIRNMYKTGEKIYSGAVEQFTQTSEYVPEAAPPAATADVVEVVTMLEEDRKTLYAPIIVDFDQLIAVNPDIEGWIYCEDSVINYPVVAAPDNEYYIERSYTRVSDPCGAIFTDAENLKGFEDTNTILYGHHMQNMSMFATLKYWLKQEYYDEHPYMWLLTPEQDYMIVLFSGYETSATSDTYTIFWDNGEGLCDYLADAAAKSLFRTDFAPDGLGKYVVLSTCAYSFEDARTVLHGKLVPVGSAGGKPIE